MSNAKLAIVATTATASDLLDACKGTAAAIVNTANGLAVIDEKIKTLRGLGVTTLGDTRKDATARMLRDQFKALNVKDATAKNYLSDLRYALENNKPFVFNVARAKAKAKGKTKAAPEFSRLIAKAYAHDDFASFMSDLLASYENAEIDNLVDGVKSFLELNGELKDTE
jgi:hypothetical protein